MAPGGGSRPAATRTASGPSMTAPTARQAPGATWPPAATGSKTAGSGNATDDQARLTAHTAIKLGTRARRAVDMGGGPVAGLGNLNRPELVVMHPPVISRCARLETHRLAAGGDAAQRLDPRALESSYRVALRCARAAGSSPGSLPGRPKRWKTAGIMNAVICFTWVPSRVSTSSASAR